MYRMNPSLKNLIWVISKAAIILGSHCKWAIWSKGDKSFCSHIVIAASVMCPTLVNGQKHLNIRYLSHRNMKV